MTGFRGRARTALVIALCALPLGAAAGLPLAGAQETTAQFEQTKTLTDRSSGDTYEATVRVERTSGLLDRSGVRVSLSGFKPSYNAFHREGNGAKIEYPVVVMQCRGAAPTPGTCLNRERSVFYAGRGKGMPAAVTEYSRLMSDPNDYGPLPGSGVVEQRRSLARTMSVPYQHSSGVGYLFNNGKVGDGDDAWLIDEPALKIYDSPDTAEVGDKAIATRRVPVLPDGTAELIFDARERVSQPSLNCSATQACSLVVVPILGLDCADPADTKCTAGPSGAPPGDGSLRTANDFLTGLTWLSPSNWDNRFVVPISFKPDPATCSIRDERRTIGVFGSELADVVQQSWGAAFCSDTGGAGYLPTYTQGSEYDARRQFTSRDGTAGYRQDAVLITHPVLDSPRPVLHAPVAMTGFSLTYTIDDANGDQVTDLVLTPRLLAKLITQSYVPGTRLGETYWAGKENWTGQPITSQADADRYYVEHPGVGRNPESLVHDPEFRALNPDMAVDITVGPGKKVPATHLAKLRNVVLFGVESDIMLEFSRYITRDPQARAWLDGAPDEHGMVVNPAWRGTTEFALYSMLDRWVRPVSPKTPAWTPLNQPPDGRYALPGAGDGCDETFRTPLLTRFANVSNTAELSALSLLERRGTSTVECAGTQIGQEIVYGEKKPDPSFFGQRALLSLTTLGHARNLEMPSAALRNAGGQAVAPDPASLAATLGAARVDQTTGVLAFDHKAITGGGYPGVMLNYLAVTTGGLDRTVAGDYADYLKYMVTDGQGTDLPAGYAPLPSPLRVQALAVAAEVRAQTGTEIPVPPGDTPLLPDMDDIPGDDDPDPTTTAPAGAPPPSAAGPTTSAAPTSTGTRQVVATEGTSSPLSRWALPALVAPGLVLGAAAGLSRVLGDPSGPVRRAITRVVRR